MALTILCPGSSGMMFLMLLVSVLLLAIPLAVGAGFLQALVRFVRELLAARR